MRAARSCLLLALLAPALAKKGAAPKTPKTPKSPAPKQPPPRRKAKPVVSALASDTNGADVSLPNLPEFHARGGYLQMNGKRVYVKGISWFGFEGDSAVVDGLWKRPVEAYIDFLANDPRGFNALRLPLAYNNIVRNPTPPAEMLSAEPDALGLSHLQILELVVQAAARRGLLVLLDLHRLDSAVWPDPNGLWYNEKVSLIDVQRAWQQLAQRFCRQWNVFGADLFNEPHGGTWGTGDGATDWDTAAETLANGVLRQCSRWVTLVEGIGQGGRTLPEYFWGENLAGVRTHPLRLEVDDKLIYSPHIYGPGLSDYMHYFRGETPMAAVWDTHFGFLYAKSTVIIGEWGGPLKDDADRSWQHEVVDYLIHRDHVGSFYWCLNPNSGDTGGILLDDWTTPHKEKIALLKPLRSTRIGPLLRGAPAFACVGSGKTLAPATSDDNYFRCREDGCVPAAQRCNGVAECADGSDEAACDFQPCVTVGGPDPFAECRLPFQYNGKLLHTCTRVDAADGKAWCPTDISEAGEYNDYRRSGVCGPGCPMPAAAEEPSSGRCGGGKHLTNVHCAPPPAPPPSPPHAPHSRFERLRTRASSAGGSATATVAVVLLALVVVGAIAVAAYWAIFNRKQKKLRSLDAEWAAQTQKVRSDAAPEAGGAAPAGGDEEEWWWLDGNDEQQGPLSEAALLELAASGAIGDSTLIWSEALGDGAPWQEYSAVTSVDARGRRYI